MSGQSCKTRSVCVILMQPLFGHFNSTGLCLLCAANNVENVPEKPLTKKNIEYCGKYRNNGHCAFLVERAEMQFPAWATANSDIYIIFNFLLRTLSNLIPRWAHSRKMCYIGSCDRDTGNWREITIKSRVATRVGCLSESPSPATHANSVQGRRTICALFNKYWPMSLMDPGGLQT